MQFQSDRKLKVIINTGVSMNEQQIFKNKVKSHSSMLQLYAHLIQEEQSCWNRFLRFQLTDTFKSCELACSVPPVFRLRIDDMIYLLGLAIIEVIFAVLPMNSNSNAALIAGYRQSIVALFICSLIEVLSGHWMRRVFLMVTCIGYPVLLLLTNQGWISLEPIDTSNAPSVANVYNYIGYLSLLPILIIIFLTYPLKEHIRTHIGSLYSYFYAYSIIVLFYLWPSYSLINAFISNTTVLSISFITNNSALVIAFSIVVFSSAYLYCHHVLFQPKPQIILEEYLLKHLNQGQITRYLEENDIQDVTVQNDSEENKYKHKSEEELLQFKNMEVQGEPFSRKKIQSENVLYKHIHLYSRMMSFVVYSTSLALFIYLLINVMSLLGNIVLEALIMAFIIVFLLLGALINRIPISREILFPIYSIVSLIPAFASLGYYNNGSIDVSGYLMLSCALPLTVILWCSIKTIPIQSPILKTNSIVYLNLLTFLPLIGYILNIQQTFTTNSNSIDIISYVLLSVVGASIILALAMFIYYQVIRCKTIKSASFSDDKQLTKQKGVDYTYKEEGNPQYVPYNAKSQFTLNYLQNVDVRGIGWIICAILFILSQLSTIYVVNQINTTYKNTVFYTTDIADIIYSQFFIVLIFYLYAHVYITTINRKEAQTSEQEGPDYSTICKWIFIIFSGIESISCLAVGYIFTFHSLTFKILGAFGLVMIILIFVLQRIKASLEKVTNLFLSPIIISIWIFLIIPYVNLITSASVFVEQSSIGLYIYICIVCSIFLLILMVAILTGVGNLIFDKFQEERKYKFIIEDVKTYLEEEGVIVTDQHLHILYESYLYRDKKYMYFLKRGFPLNVLHDHDEEIHKLVTSEDYILKKIPTKKQIISEEQKKKKNCVWNCLTFFCGEEEEEVIAKIKKANKKIDREELKLLLPPQAIGLIEPRNNKLANVQKKKKKQIQPSKIFSSKSLILKTMKRSHRSLGEEYIFLKTQKDKSLAIELFHNIFEFISNNDYTQKLIIPSDFTIFMNSLELPFSNDEIKNIFYDFAKIKWRQILSLDMKAFSLVIQNLVDLFYTDQKRIKNQELKYYFLVENIYYNLCCYEEFVSFINTKRINKNRVSKSQIQKSPFNSSFLKYQLFKQERSWNQVRLVEITKKHHQDKAIDPKQNIQVDIISQKQVQIQKKKEKSCKRMLYEKYQNCQKCCKKQVEVQDHTSKKAFLKTWQDLSVESIKTLQKKQQQWAAESSKKQQLFRCISNNILMAVFKILDIYTYVEITINNGQLGWKNQGAPTANFTNLIISYRVQLYLALGIALICIPFGTKGIFLILENRLGLTESRLPAAFPHPMFFFTFMYKLLILSLFSTVSQTLLVTLNCTWTAPPPFYLYDDSSFECFTFEHNIYIIASIIALVIYYPLSSFAMPNFQFAQKRLDLKYRPSYLILYFQVNFLLLAGRVVFAPLLTAFTYQMIFNSINIFALVILCISVLSLKPCLIQWFNYVQFLTIFIGIIFNCLGLILYLTGQWLICLILAIVLSVISIVLTIIFVKRRYFSSHSNQIENLKENDEINEIQMTRVYNLNRKKRLMAGSQQSKMIKITSLKENEPKQQEEVQ